MKSNQAGLTSEERERLTTQPEEEKKMDLKMSLLAFAGILLVCALIMAASIIARSQGKSDSPGIGSWPHGEPTETAYHVGNAGRTQTQGQRPQLGFSPPRQSVP